MDFGWYLSKINLFYQTEECMSENGMSDDMWKLNVRTFIKSDMNKASTYAYILESSNL